MSSALKFLAILFFLGNVFCGESYRTVFESNKETGESIRLYKFERQSADENGKMEWIMNAEEAYIFRKNEEESKIVAYNFHFMQYNPETGARQTDMSAGRGEIDYENKKVILSGGVKFRESETKYGEAETMHYDMETKIISTGAKVILYDDGRVTRCLKGIEVDKANNKEVCRGPAVIQRQQEGSEQQYNDLFH